MKIRELAKKWPPQVVGRFGAGPMVDRGDKVLTAHRHPSVRDQITLGVRKKDNTIYIAALDLPVRLIGEALIEIVREKKIPLGELGELDI